MPGKIEADIVTGLVDVCRNAAKGFRLATDCVADPELKRIFLSAGRRHDVFATELLPFAHAPTSDGTAAGEFHRRWMTLKHLMTGHDEAAILAEAIRGESIAIVIYDDAVHSMLPPNARPVVQRQREEIRGLLEDLRLYTLPCV